MKILRFIIGIANLDWLILINYSLKNIMPINPSVINFSCCQGLLIKVNNEVRLYVLIMSRTRFRVNLHLKSHLKSELSTAACFVMLICHGLLNN